MDYLRKFEVELDKDVYYAGEILTGRVIAKITENVKVHGIRLLLRGKAHVEWKISKAGERRTVRDDEYYIDEKRLLWGKDKKDDGPAAIMPRGNHKYPFEFKLPESALPCSLESKIGTIRYYIRAYMDFPFASVQQAVKYFTVIGPHIDCMEEQYLSPTRATDKRRTCCMCCSRGPVSIEAVLERSAYCCGENIRLKVEIQNGSNQNAWIICRLQQNVEYFINKGVLGLRKDVDHNVWEYKGEHVDPHSTEKFDNLQQFLQVPVMPPTMVDVCGVIQIYYVLKVSLVMEDAGEVLELEFNLTVATTPFRIPNAPYPVMQHDHCVENVEGGMYISSEFQVGQVYMGDTDEAERENIILYRPVYICVPHERIQVTNIEREGVSRAGSRISMTRLFDRKSWKMQSSSRDSEREDSSVTDLQARDDEYPSRDGIVGNIDGKIIHEKKFLCTPEILSDNFKKESELSSDCLGNSGSLESLKLTEDQSVDDGTSNNPHLESSKKIKDIDEASEITGDQIKTNDIAKSNGDVNISDNSNKPHEQKFIQNSKEKDKNTYYSNEGPDSDNIYSEETITSTLQNIPDDRAKN